MLMRPGRLKSRQQFLEITKKGHKAVTRSFVVFCMPGFIPRQLPPYQAFDVLAGYTVTKKLGNAVTRNRIRRRLRAVMDDTLPAALPPGLRGAGLVVIARHNALTADYADMCAEARKCLNWLRKQV